jgi:hypothetical protein
LIYFTEMFKQDALNKELNTRYNEVMQRYQMTPVFSKGR